MSYYIYSKGKQRKINIPVSTQNLVEHEQPAQRHFVGVGRAVVVKIGVGERFQAERVLVVRRRGTCRQSRADNECQEQVSARAAGGAPVFMEIGIR